MLRKYVSILMAPADALGGGGGAATAELPPNSIGDFMSSLPSLDDAPETAKKEEKPNGDTALPNKGSADAAAKPNAGDADSTSNAGPGAASDQTKSAGNQNANKPVGTTDKPGEKSADSKGGTTEDDKWPRSSNDWETFKKRRAEEREKAKAEIATRDAQITELQGKVKTFEETAGTSGENSPEVKGQLDKLTKENEALLEQIRMFDVTQHPKWKSYFGEREQEQREIAASVLGEDRAKAFMEIMSIPNTEGLKDYKKAKMEEFSSDMSGYEQRIIGNVEAELMKLERQKQQEVKKNSEHVAQLRQNKDTEQKTVQAARDKIFSNTVTQLSDPKTGLSLFQKKQGEGTEEWNKQVDEITHNAKRYFFGAKDLKPEEIATAAMHAAAMPVLLKGWQSDMAAKEKEIATLQEQVKRLTAAQPGGAGRGGEGGGGEGGGGSSRTRVEPGMTPEQATSHLVKSWTQTE